MERHHIFKLGAALLFYAIYCIKPTFTNGIHHNSVDENNTKIEPAKRPDDFLVYYQGVEGTPGIDFPIYSHIPRTSFSCKGIDSGYYADLDTDCQVFHICEEERKISFLCPNGTIFQQSDLICEWWFKVNCTDAPNLYEESAELLREDLARRKSFRRVHLDGNEINHGAVLRAEELTTATAHKNSKTVNLNHRINSTPQNIVVEEDRKSLNGQDNVAKTSKSRRYNDAQTGNYLNNVKQNPKRTSTDSYLNNKSHTLKEYHVQFASTSSGSDVSFNEYVESTTPSINIFDYTVSRNKEIPFSDTNTLLNRKTSNRGSVRFNIVNNKDDTSTNEYLTTPSNHLSAPNELILENPKSSSTYITADRKNQRNDLPDSDESQIPQESSSFIKSSFNSIKDSSKKYFTSNPYPNHRTTYSDLKQPNLATVKSHSTISSVTPQYITTQPINNGKPFLGSRVGANIHTTVGTITTQGGKFETLLESDSSNKGDSLTIEPFEQSLTPTINKDNLNGYTGLSLSTQPFVSSVLHSSGNSYYNENKKLNTADPFPSHSTSITSNNVASTEPTPLSIESETKKTVDHATVYGVPSQKPTQPSSAKVLQIISSTKGFESDSNQVFIGGSLRASTIKPNLENKSTLPQIQLSLRQGVQVKFDKNVDKIGLSLGKSLSDPLGNYVKYSSTIQPPLVRENSFKGISSSITNLPKYDNLTTTGLNNYNSQNSVNDNSVSSPRAGFFVTKNSAHDLTSSYKHSTPKIYSDNHSSIASTTVRPRPFQKNINNSPFTRSTTEKSFSVTYPDYKISSASPFKSHNESKILSIEPTLPTPFIKMAETEDHDFSSETPRPGLVVPPSAGPQTLHTLAVYFANTLDGVVKEKKLTDEETKKMKEELTTLLTQMTIHGYNQLFKNNKDENVDTMPVPLSDEGPNGLQTEQSKNLVQSPEIRMLARNFSLALASYLNDPEMFRKDLEDLRPTEPSGFEIVKDIDETVIDEELLNFSDADTKSSFPPQPSPTWGFILATESNDIDVKNALNPDLNTADSQSFIPTYNNLNDIKNLPQGHWTTSPSATKLWSNTFGVNPASVNDHFVTTVATPSAEAVVENFSGPEKDSEFDPPHGEVRYELRSLPKLALNTTQIHGILIDFMNTTHDDSSRLHRLLKKLNTSEEEFLSKMKEIESNPLTKRLILLLISECGVKATQDISQLDKSVKENIELVDVEEKKNEDNSSVHQLVNPSLSEEDQDVRALQLLNSLYSIASKFGK